MRISGHFKEIVVSMPSLSQLSAMPRSILLDHLLQRAWGYSMRLLLSAGIKSVIVESRRGDVDVTLAPTVYLRIMLWDVSLIGHSFNGTEEDSD